MKLGERRHLIVAAALALTFVAAGITRLTVGVCGVYHDDAIYVSTAKALAEGQGYRLINLPGAPLQTKYPVLYPAILSVIWKLWPVFPQNLLAMQLLSLLCGAVALAAGYLYLIRFGHCPPMAAALGGAICATSPRLAYFGTQTLSELPFAVLLVLALWVIDRELECPSTNRTRSFLTGFAVGLPFLCRTIGGAVIPVALWLFYRRRGRVPWVTATGLFPIILWVMWAAVGQNEQAAGTVEPARYYTDYLGWWADAASRLPIRIIVLNTLIALTSTSAIPLEGFQRLLPSAYWPAFACTGMMTWAALIIGRRKGSALTPVLLMYTAVVLIWPWPPTRFLVPVVPLLAPFLWMPFVVWPKTKPYTAAVVAGLSAVAISANLLLLYRHHTTTAHTHFPTEAIPVSAVTWQSFQNTFSWVNDHTEPDDVLAAGMDTMMFLYTGRVAFKPFLNRPASLFYGDTPPAVGTVDEFAAIVARYSPRYLVRTPMPGFAEERPFNELLERVESERPSCLRVVHRALDDPRFAVYAVQARSCTAP